MDSKEACEKIFNARQYLNKSSAANMKPAAVQSTRQNE